MISIFIGDVVFRVGFTYFRKKYIIIMMIFQKEMDLLPWTVTFVMSLLVGLEFGILTGLLISIVFLLYYAARPGVRVSKGEVDNYYTNCLTWITIA